MNEKKLNDAWQEIQECINSALSSNRKIDIVAVDTNQANDVLQKMSADMNIYLKAIITHAAAISVDYGWLRILGSGNKELPRSISVWNKSGSEDRLSHATLFADDILGGFFAVNEGAFNGLPGEVFYFAPDTLAWEGLDVSVDNFIKWVFSDNFREFYSTFIWSNWETEIKNLSFDQVLSVYPPLWSESMSIEKRSRKGVSIDEAWKLNKHVS